MSYSRLMLILVLLFGSAIIWAEPTNLPSLGYVYPAGGQQGTTFQVTLGGQFLKSGKGVYITGEGITTKIIQYVRPIRNLNGDQKKTLNAKLKEVRQMRYDELTGKSSRSASAKKPPVKKGPPKTPEQIRRATLPAHPLLNDIEKKSLRELAHMASILYFPRTKLQMNRQLNEMVLVEITIDKDAAPGNRELRLGTSTGLTNPMVFQVGLAKEHRELEPNNRHAYQELTGLPKTIKLPKERPLNLPVTLNGQIMPGDVDRFRFVAKKGQKLSINAQARSLIPYLADAVPGWFQATIALYDSKGSEIAFSDDYLFNPDPVLFYEIPASGEYELEIRDSIYRGREDFVYRVTVSEQPFITQMFPLGGRSGLATYAMVSGWNLQSTKLPLDTKRGADSIRQTAYHKGKVLSNFVPYAVDAISEVKETESNSSLKDAQRIIMPKIINGLIDKPGDIDVYQFSAKAGSKIVAEVYSRRLNSPLDSLVRLTDASGKLLEWNDDHVLMDSFLHKDIMGLVTHHADSYLQAELPKTGTYFLHLSDAQNHGSPAHAYRLRLSTPQPDFALRVGPTSISMKAGAIAQVYVHVLRKDGFDGEIEVALKDAPAGFKLTGGRIPAGSDRIRMTIKAPTKAPFKPISLKLEGRARVNGKTISNLAVPADDTMQAFLFRHLVPAKDMMVIVQKTKVAMPPVQIVGNSPLKISAGATTQVRLKTTANAAALKGLKLELYEPPDGVTLQDVKISGQNLTFKLKTDSELIESSYSDNLIIEAYKEYTPKAQPGKPVQAKRRTFISYLPAIPIEVVKREVAADIK